MGNSPTWTGSLSVSQAVMRDALDLSAVRRALRRLGLPSERPLTSEEADKVVACFAKAEAESNQSSSWPAPCDARRR